MDTENSTNKEQISVLNLCFKENREHVENKKKHKLKPLQYSRFRIPKKYIYLEI